MKNVMKNELDKFIRELHRAGIRPDMLKTALSVCASNIPVGSGQVFSQLLAQNQNRGGSDDQG